MQRNNKTLYEQIMKNVSKSVKNALYENNLSNIKCIPYDQIDFDDFQPIIRNHQITDDLYYTCYIDFYEILSIQRSDIIIDVDEEKLDKYLDLLKKSDQDKKEGEITIYYYLTTSMLIDYEFDYQYTLPSFPRNGFNIKNSKPNKEFFEVINDSIYCFLDHIMPNIRQVKQKIKQEQENTERQEMFKRWAEEVEAEEATKKAKKKAAEDKRREEERYRTWLSQLDPYTRMLVSE